jgi:cytochrome P450
MDVLHTNSYDFTKPRGGREFLARGLGYGLILSEGDAHRAQRKAVTPAFAIKNIRAMYDLMWSKTQIFLHQLDREIQLHPVPGMKSGASGYVELGSWARYGHSPSASSCPETQSNPSSRLTLDIIGPAAVGRDFQSLENEDDPVSQAYSAILKPSSDTLLLFALSVLFPQWLVKLVPVRANIELPRRISYLRRVFHDILREKRTQLTEKPSDVDGDILGTMMRGGEFSDSELVDQMLTFLAAGVRILSPLATLPS